jgi:hypothetical protein
VNGKACAVQFTVNVVLGSDAKAHVFALCENFIVKSRMGMHGPMQLPAIKLDDLAGLLVGTHPANIICIATAARPIYA